MNTIKKFLHICCLIALATSPVLAGSKSFVEVGLDNWINNFAKANTVAGVKEVRSDFNALESKAKEAIYEAMRYNYNTVSEYDTAVRELLLPGSRTDMQLVKYASIIRSKKEGKKLLDTWIDKFATAKDMVKIKEYRSAFNNLPIVEKTAINMAMAKNYNKKTKYDKAVRALLFPGPRTDEQLVNYASKIRTSTTPLTVPSEEEDSNVANPAPVAQNQPQTFNTSVGGQLLSLFVDYGGALNATLNNSTIMPMLISVVSSPNGQTIIRGYLNSPLLTTDQKLFLSNVANDSTIFDAFKSVLSNEKMINSLKTLTTPANIEKAIAINNADGKVTAAEAEFLGALFTKNKETIKTLAPMLELSEDQINQLNSFDGNVEALGFLPPQKDSQAPQAKTALGTTEKAQQPGSSSSTMGKAPQPETSSSTTVSEAPQPETSSTTTVSEAPQPSETPISLAIGLSGRLVDADQHTTIDIAALMRDVKMKISQESFAEAADILDGISEDTLAIYADDHPDQAEALILEINDLKSGLSPSVAGSGEPVETLFSSDTDANTQNINGANQTAASAAQSGSYDSGCYNFP